MSISVREYLKEVGTLAHRLVLDNKADYESKEELEEAINDTLLHEAIDGHQWIVYYAYNLDVYNHSGNQDYFEDNFGGDGLVDAIVEGGSDELHQAFAFWCLYADVQEVLHDVLEDLEY